MRFMLLSVPKVRRLIALCLSLGVLVVSGCGDQKPTESPIEIAARLLRESNPEASLEAARDALRANPDDPEARLLLAEIYIELGDGGLALASIDQALAKGIDANRTMLPRARALFVDKRFNDVVGLALPESLDAASRVRLVHVKAKAQSSLSVAAAGSDDDVTKTYIELFESVDRYKSDIELDDVISDLARERAEDANAERAWQHYSCRNADTEFVRWQPLRRPGARVLRVGLEQEIKTLSDAARIAQDGDIVEIDSGRYEGGVALWPQHDIVVRGVGERPVITANGTGIQDRDVWLFTGDRVVVENVEISGARSPYENGAGIRHIGRGLTLRHVYLHDNENGVLTGNRHPDTNSVLIEFSEFAHNGDNKGRAHNIYIGRSRDFEMRFSYSRAAQGGHLVKSRARHNLVAYNRLTDEEDGRSSYIVDIPEGGIATIIGNVIEKGAENLNHGMVSYAGESSGHVDNRLQVASNSFYNRDFKGIVVRNHAGLAVTLVNNLFGGAPVAVLDGPGESRGNLLRPEHGMLDPRSYEFELKPGAAAIDAAIDFEQVPRYEYRHPVRGRIRAEVWKLDAGALERCGL